MRIKTAAIFLIILGVVLAAGLLNCRRCHDAVSSLTVTDNIHRGLKWLSVGGVLFALAGFIVSLTVINRKGKAA